MKIPAGSTSYTVPVVAQDITSSSGALLGGILFNSAGLAAKYRREGSNAWTTITLQTATVGTFPTGGGGWVADGGPFAGGYEFSIPNAVIAAGARWAEVVIYGFANMLPIIIPIELTATNDQDPAAGGLSRLDAAVSTRLSTAGYTAPTTPPTVQAIRTEIDSNSSKLANLDAAVSTRLAAASYTAPTTPPTVQQIRQEIDANSTKLTNAVPTAAGIAAAVLAATIDNVALSKIMQIVLSVLGNKTVIQTNGNIVTLHFRDRADTADVLVLQYDKTTGARSSGGAIT